MDAFHVFSELPQLFAPLPRASIMSQWDQTAQKLGLPGAVLMENAARSAFQALLATFQDLTDLEVGLLIGSGNNGGDAAAIGRYLHEAGLAVTAYLIKDFHAYQGECAHQLQILRTNKLVKSRREGKQMYYSLADDHVVTIIGQGLSHILE